MYIFDIHTEVHNCWHTLKAHIRPSTMLTSILMYIVNMHKIHGWYINMWYIAEARKLVDEMKQSCAIENLFAVCCNNHCRPRQLVVCYLTSWCSHRIFQTLTWIFMFFMEHRKWYLRATNSLPLGQTKYQVTLSWPQNLRCALERKMSEKKLIKVIK
jgi:hypothetical protein